MTPAQRAQRNAAIFAARARGFGWTRIAADHGVSERQAQRICREQRENRPRVTGIDPLEVVEEVLDGYSAASEDLAHLANTTTHDGTKLGAVRARIDVLRARMDLLT